MSTQKQERLLSKKPEIIVATPGRFWELLQENNSHIIDFSNLRFLAIDETDRMIEKGHFEELEKILSLIKKYNLSSFSFFSSLSLILLGMIIINLVKDLFSLPHLCFNSIMRRKTRRTRKKMIIKINLVCLQLSSISYF